MKYFLFILGCQMNYSDGERVATVLENLGYEKSVHIKQADLIIFVTCSIRQKAEDRVFGFAVKLAEMKKQRPGLKIGITGCMVRKTSSINTAGKNRDVLFKKMPVIDFVFRIEDLMKLPEILQESEQNPVIREFSDANIADYFKIAAKHSSKVQAFVPIQTGCDKFCTYCIVPFSRGKEWSRTIEEIVEECTKLAAQGYLEITLIGQTVNSYGQSLIDRKSEKFTQNCTTPFVQLLHQLDKISGLKRVRYTSPHPHDMTDDLIEAQASLTKLCPYVHLPIQSGDNEILRRMNRNYTVEQYRQIIKKIRSSIPDCAISTDIIVGFCGETEQQFDNTYNLYQEMEWDHAFLSRYSPRKSTYAAQRLNDDISREEKAIRWHKLNDLLKKISYKKHQAFMGKIVEVLVESYKNGFLEGRSEHFKTVRFPGNKHQVGTLMPVLITKARELELEGEQLNFSQKLNEKGKLAMSSY